MKNLDLKENKKILYDLVLEGEDLLITLDEAFRKQEATNRIVDNLAYSKGLKNKTDEIIGMKSKLHLKHIKKRCLVYLEKASEFVDIERYISKSPSVNLKFNKKGLIQNFVNDLNIRMVNVEIENYIKDVKRVELALYRKLKSLDRAEEELDINQKFSEIRKKIEEL